MVKKLLAVLLAALFMTSCGGDKDNVMSARKFAAVLYDYHLAQSLSLDLSLSNAYQQELYYNYVFEKHGITRDEFDRTLSYYTRHPGKFHDIYVKMYDRVDADREVLLHRIEIAKKKLDPVGSGDSIDLWGRVHNQILTQSHYLNPIVFDINVDTTFYLSDSIFWTAGITFQDTVPSSDFAYISMSLDYGDSISTVDTLMERSGTFSLKLGSDDKKTADRLVGSITYQDTLADSRKRILLTDVLLLRTHRNIINADSLAIQSDSIDAVADTVNVSDEDEPLEDSVEFIMLE